MSGCRTNNIPLREPITDKKFSTRIIQTFERVEWHQHWEVQTWIQPFHLLHLDYLHLSCPSCIIFPKNKIKAKNSPLLMCITATSRLPLMIVVSFTYFHLSTQNLLDSLTLGVVIGDIGFPVGAMLQEDLVELKNVLGKSVEGWTYFHLST